MSHCPCLIAATEGELRKRLGEPRARRTAGGGLWLVFELPNLSLRVRCGADPPHAVRSWTATFSDSCETLAEAAGALGLWPHAAPDLQAAAASEPLIRRAITCPDIGRTVSLTASIGADGISRLSLFDEPPEWP